VSNLEKTRAVARLLQDVYELFEHFDDVYTVPIESDLHAVRVAAGMLVLLEKNLKNRLQED
jgi:hypothetical protein